MNYFKSIVAYDGTDFHGFQRQAEGLRTVQSELEKALRSIGWLGNSLAAAGRTDAGVHARGQVIAFRMNWRADDQDLIKAINANLPADIAIWHVEKVVEDFHPRFSAIGRRYEYSIYLSSLRDPRKERNSWRVWPRPENERLDQVAKAIVGVHDFAAFGQAPIVGGHTTREVTLAEWESEPESLTFVIEANAFLNHMVRRLVAAAISIGQGKRELEYFQELISNPSERWQDPIAPPQGLSLERVYYPDLAGFRPPDIDIG